MSNTIPVPIAERTSHPFYTHDMIKDIPKAFTSTLEVLRGFDTAAEASSSGKRLVFTGNGTAFYSAEMGSQILGLSSADWGAIQALELTNYEGEPGKGIVIGISHSGITKSTVDALAKAKSRGARTIGITHFSDRPISKVSDKTLVIGDSPDKSRCHTKTYVDSAAAAFEISLKFLREWGFLQGELNAIKEEFEKGLVLKVQSTISSTEQDARKAAEEFRSVSKIFFAGAGPNYITSREAALKIKETSYLGAEGMELEEILHGPAMSFDRDTLVVAMAPSGPAVERTKDLISAARTIGARTLVVSDGSANFDSDRIVQVPRTHEYLSPFLTIIPLYFFSYYLSVGKGNNPDYLRYLDPTYWNARGIIFPPGTH